MKVKKRYLIYIPVIMITAVFLVAMLAWISLRPLHIRNGFDRRLSGSELQLVQAKEISKDIVDVCGATDARIYFQTISPKKLWVTDLSLQNGHYEEINIPVGQRIASAFTTTVDSPNITVMAMNGPAVIQTDFMRNTTIYKFPSAIYSKAAQISKTSFVFRGFDTAMHSYDQVFMKGNPSLGLITRDSLSVFSLNHDAGISSDGWLNYDSTSKKLVYVLSYKNKYICLDTNLHVVYQANTIDSIIASASPVMGAIKNGEEKYITNASPTRYSNVFSVVDNGILYNISKIKADNQLDEDFYKKTTIDVYRIKDGNYLYSLLVPAYKKNKVKRFRVIGKLLIAIHENYCVIYQLPK